MNQSLQIVLNLFRPILLLVFIFWNVIAYAINDDDFGRVLEDPYAFVFKELENRCCAGPCEDKSMVRSQPDLNADGVGDLILFPGVCRGNGGGPMYIFLKVGQQYKLIGSSASQPHCVEILNSATNKFSDLRTYFRHVGNEELKYNGLRYTAKAVKIPNYLCKRGLNLEETVDLTTWAASR